MRNRDAERREDADGAAESVRAGKEVVNQNGGFRAGVAGAMLARAAGQLIAADGRGKIGQMETQSIYDFIVSVLFEPVDGETSCAKLNTALRQIVESAR